MSQHHNHSPSKLGTMTKDRCQGRAREEATWPDLDLGSGDEGTGLHHLLALELCSEPWSGDSEQETLVHKCQAWLATKDVEQIIGVEMPLSVMTATGAVLTEGTADLCVRYKNGALGVIDWKFAHEPIDETTARIQLTCYLVALMQANGYGPDATATGYLYLPRLDLEYRAVVVLGHGLAELESIVAGASAPDAPLKAGSWCRWCSARVGCPAVREAGSQLMTTFGVTTNAEATKAALKERYMAQLGALSERGEFPRIAEIARLAQALEPAIEAAKTVVKALIEAGFGRFFPEWDITTEKVRAPTNMLEIYRRLGEVLSDQEFAECLDLKWGEVERHYHDRCKLIAANVNGKLPSAAESKRRLAGLLNECVVFVERKKLVRSKK